MKKLIVLLVLCCLQAATAQPRLVVVISLDQFPYDYISRFRPWFGEGGFNYLLDHGANFSNATYKHALNMTGPGHAVILSGSYGNQNGIIANDWYDPEGHRGVYCVRDTVAHTLGASAPGVSPRNFLGSTFGDQLRLHTSFRSRVVAVSNKDRAAILMGGIMANAAYWMVDSAFVSSDYYMNELPSWVNEFNESGMVTSYFGQSWEKCLPEDAYQSVDEDDVPYENAGANGRTFPHRITGESTSRVTRSYFNAVLTSPFGSEILAAFAREAVRNEELGQRGVTDLLCVSFSSNDYVGHAFGPNSQEVMDMTVRTDKILNDFFAFLDLEVGLGNCLIVLTSDHGVAPIPEYVLAHSGSTDAGRVKGDVLTSFCNASLAKAFGARKKGNWIEAISNNNIYINREAVRERKTTLEAASAALADSLRTMHAIGAAYSREEMIAMVPNSRVEQCMRRSFHPVRSGDVFYALRPFYIEGYAPTGTTHGEPYDYDAHVPLLICGDGIRNNTFMTEASPADIGPTLSTLLGITAPAAREGRVLVEALK